MFIQATVCVAIARRIFEGTSAERELDALEAERRVEQAQAAQEPASEPEASTDEAPDTPPQQDTP